MSLVIPMGFIAGGSGSPPRHTTLFTVDTVLHSNGDTVNLANGTTSVAIAGADGSSIESLMGNSGLSTGDNACTFTVRAEDGVTTLDVTLNLHVLDTGVAEQTQIVCLDDTSGNRSNRHLSLHDANGSVGVWLNGGLGFKEQTRIDLAGATRASFVTGADGHDVMVFSSTPGNAVLFWFDVGTETAPSVGQGTTIPVDLSGADPDITDADIAELLRQSFIASYPGGAISALSGASFTVENSSDGNVLDASTSFASPISVNVALQGTGPGASAPGGYDRTLEVDYSTNDSAATIAAAIAAVLNADGAFSAAAVGDTLTITDAAIGARTDADSGDTGFSVSTTIQGRDPA